MTAFVITNQWNRSRDAERVISVEADASVSLALASGARGLVGEGIRTRQVRYLQSLLEQEWSTLEYDDHGCADTVAALMDLQIEVRDRAADQGVADPVSARLAVAATDVATARRDRVNLAGHGLPAPLFLLVLVSGVVVCVSGVLGGEPPELGRSHRCRIGDHRRPGSGPGGSDQ